MICSLELLVQRGGRFAGAAAVALWECVVLAMVHQNHQVGTAFWNSRFLSPPVL